MMMQFDFTAAEGNIARILMYSVVVWHFLLKKSGWGANFKCRIWRERSSWKLIIIPFSSVPSSLEYAVSRSRDKGSSSSTSVCKRVLVRIKGRGELSTAAYIVAEYFSICYLSQRLDCVVSTFNSCLVWVDLGYARRIPTWSLDYVHMKRAGWGGFSVKSNSTLSRNWVNHESCHSQSW